MAQDCCILCLYTNRPVRAPFVAGVSSHDQEYAFCTASARVGGRCVTDIERSTVHTMQMCAVHITMQDITSHKLR